MKKIPHHTREKEKIEMKIMNYETSCTIKEITERKTDD